MTVEEQRLARIEQRTEQVNEHCHALEALGEETGRLDAWISKLPRRAWLRRRRALQRLNYLTDDMIALREASTRLLTESYLDLAIVSLNMSIEKLTGVQS